MLDNQILIEALYYYGREKALELRAEAPQLTDTEVIEQELFIPTWHEGQQILNAVVKYEGQVYRVLQAHDSTGNPSWNPASSSALFGICHTKNPLKAKPWVAPMGTSGLYYLDECYVDIYGTVWKQVFDGGNVYDAATIPERWEMANLYGEDIPEEEEEVVVIDEPNNNENNEPDNPPTDESIIDNPPVNEWPDWIQPIGTQDAYNTGAQVLHNNLHWISIIDNNVWEPGVYGWEQTN